MYLRQALARLGARWHPVQRRYIAPDEATIRRHVKMIDANHAGRLVGEWLWNWSAPAGSPPIRPAPS